MDRIKILYYDSKMTRLGTFSKGDWIDLRVARLTFPEGDMNQPYPSENKLLQWKIFPDQFFLIRFGIAVQLPVGHEAWVLPRSSLFKKYGLILTNSMGVIDNSYCGYGDEWAAPVYSLRHTIITQYDRLFQFRIAQNMEPLDIVEGTAEEFQQQEERGGFGTTDKQ